METAIVISLDAPACSNTDVLGGFVKRVKPTCAAEHVLGEFNSPDSSCENAVSWSKKAVSHQGRKTETPQDGTLLVSIASLSQIIFYANPLARLSVSWQDIVQHNPSSG